MKILVTGANGLLGQKLVQLLSRQKEVEVIATARKELTKIPGVSFEIMDITSSVQTEEVLLRTKPEVVINTAAMTQVDQCETERDLCWLHNVIGVENLVSACEKIKARLVHVSTDFIFDGSHGPLDESAIPAPVNFYGESKWVGEKVVQGSHLEWAILRTVLVYGVTDDMSRSNIVLWVKKSLEEGKNINVVDDQWRTPTLAEDLAMGCYLAAKQKAKGIYHISGEEMMTPYDIAIRTAAFFGLNKNLINKTDSSKFRQPALRPPKTGFVITKAKTELNYQPHRFEEGLALIKSLMESKR